MKTPNPMAIRVTPQTYDILLAMEADKASRMRQGITYYLVINVPEVYFPTNDEGMQYGAPALVLVNRLFSYTLFHQRWSFVGLEIDNQFVKVKEKPPAKEKVAKTPITIPRKYDRNTFVKMPWDLI